MKTVLLLACTLILAGSVRGEDSFVEKLDAHVAQTAQKQGYVGVSFAVVRDGKIVLAKGYGKSSMASGAPVTVDTKFGIGSVTKQFTCACILLLAEDGKLDINDSVAMYYPNLTRSKDITLLDLMTHLAGYPDYYPLDFVDRRMMKPTAVEQVVSEYASAKLDFEPRSRWSYSNTGYLLLGRIIEKVSGEPFEKFLERRILRPLEMNNTVFEPETGAAGLADGHASFALGAYKKAEREAAGWIHAAGGLYSTPTDLAKWDIALMEGKLLRPNSFKILSTPAKLADGKTTDYCCGLAVTMVQGTLAFGHGGGVSGFISQNAMIPATKSAAIVLTNCEEFLTLPRLHREILAKLAPPAPKPDESEAKKDEPKRQSAIPKVDGLPAKEFALDFLHQMQAGKIDRNGLGAEFDFFLTPEKVADAAPRLKAFGEPKEVVVESKHERGGMEVAVVRFVFGHAALKAIMYRTPDGKLQQYLVQKGSPES